MKVGPKFAAIFYISDWYTKVIISKDNGNTWSEPVELVMGVITSLPTLEEVKDLMKKDNYSEN